MNKKGFTLVELLAVIVILAVVMLIGTVSIGGVRNKINKNMFETKLELIIGAAKSWGQDNKEELANDKTIKYLNASNAVADKTKAGTFKTVQDLIASTDLETDEKDSGGNKIVTNDMTGKVVNNLEVFVYLDNNRVYACIPVSDANRNELEEKSDWSEYSHLNYYCR